MKDIINERIRQLGAAQESMLKMESILEQLDHSQQRIEKDAYESMNASDRVQNLSKEGKNLIVKLKESAKSFVGNQTSEGMQMMSSQIEEVNNIFNKIMAASQLSNEILHTIELEAACRCEITDSIRNQVKNITDSIDKAVACAEMVLTSET